jgi:leukotriene-A4 hydrolase
MTITLEKDPNSYADPTKVETKHLHLDLNVDFEEKVFICTAKLLLHVKETTDSISLDTRDLAIDGVHIANLDAPALVNWPSGGKLTEQFWNSNIGPLFFYTSTGEAAVNSSASSAGKECKWELGANHQAFGSPLEINTPSPLQKNSVALLTIQYKTSPSCSACQWLDPIQTAGKKFPYLFTQCQAIHARSLVPCQDSPGLKFSYSASVKVEKPLTAVMSALDCGKDDSDPASTIYRFKQPVPIPVSLSPSVQSISIQDSNHCAMC